jgi:hypothetical protein
MSSQYIILKYQSIFIGDFAQIAVYSYDTADDKPEVYIAFIEGWSRVNNVAGDENPVFEELLGNFLRKFNTKTLLQEFIENREGYTVFQFGVPNDSLSAAETLAEEIANTLLLVG